MNKHFAPAKVAQFVTIEGRALKEALGPVASIVERRNTFPILANVKIEVAGAVLVLTGTDLDMEVHTEADVIDAGGDWCTTVNARSLAAVAGAAGGAPLRIEHIASDDKCTVTVGEGDVIYDLPTLSADSFPELKAEAGDVSERFTNGRLAMLLRRVGSCMASESTRYYLNGVCWRGNATGRLFVATDGHRLTVSRYAGPDGHEFSHIIPRKTVQFLCAHTAGQDVTLRPTDRSAIGIAFGRTKVRSKLIDGTYPDFERVVPANDRDDSLFEFSRQDLLSAIDNASVFATKRYGNAVRFYPSKDRVAIARNDADFGNATAVTQSIWPAAGLNEFGVNGNYLRGFAASCEGRVVLHVHGAGDPIRITDDDETMTRVLMPMRV